MPPDHLRQTRVLLANLASATRELAPQIQNMLHDPWINLVFYIGERGYGWAAGSTLVSLAAVFVSSRNASLEERCVTRQKQLRGRLAPP